MLGSRQLIRKAMRRAAILSTALACAVASSKAGLGFLVASVHPALSQYLAVWLAASILYTTKRLLLHCGSEPPSGLEGSLASSVQRALSDAAPQPHAAPVGAFAAGLAASVAGPISSLVAIVSRSARSDRRA
jgi:hypothetical protein